MVRRRHLLWIALVTVLAGCSFSAAGNPDNLDRLRHQAHDELARYDRAVRAAGDRPVAPVGELTGQIGDWEPAGGDNNKLALASGRVVAAVAMPDASQATGRVTWDSGATEDVGLISSGDAGSG